jgi:hypothetical protein
MEWDMGIIWNVKVKITGILVKKRGLQICYLNTLPGKANLTWFAFTW